MLSAKNYILSIIVISAGLIVLIITFSNVIFKELISVKGIGAAIGMFTFIEIVSCGLIEMKSKTITPQKSINLLLGIKTGKILLSLLFVAVYALAVKVETQRFLMVFIGLYFIYLFLNTIYITRREKQLKANRIGEKEEIR